MRTWRAYLWPGVAFALGVLMWPVMAFFTNSAIHMYAHGAWAQVMMLAGGGRAGARRTAGCTRRWWRLTLPLAFVVSGIAFIVHEQNAWFFARSAFLHHLLGWTFARRRRSSRSALAFRPRSLVLPRRLRAARRRGRGDALLRPRRRADLRPPVAAGGGAAPVRRIARSSRSLALLAFPAVASAHATLERDDAAFGDRGAGSAGQDPAALRPGVRRCPARSACWTRRATTSRAAGASKATTSSPAVHTLPRGAYTVRWHAISADSHVVSGVWTFGVRVPAPSVGEAYGAGGPTTIEHVVRWLWFLGLALAIGALGFRLLVPARPRGAARARAAVAVAAGVGASRALEAGIAAFSLRARTRCSCRSAGSSTATSRRSRRRVSARAFIVMTLGFAFVLCADLPVVAARPGRAARARVRARARASSPGSRSRVTTPSMPARRG